jgi:hypothetical protein
MQSVDGTVTHYGLDGPGSNSGGDEIFGTHSKRPWGPSSLLYNGTPSFPGVKPAGRDVNHPPYLAPR